MQAYDITILRTDADRSDAWNAGWCFGLPPGIQPHQWPLDPCNGYPLVHGFTVLIPTEYRCCGRDEVALSFFGTPEDMDVGWGGPFIEDDIVAAFKPDADEPKDTDLKVFWDAARNGHPRLYRLGGGDLAQYAAILLTQTEFDGAFCPPPPLGANRWRDRIDPPEWLKRGGAAAAVRAAGDSRLIAILGEEPEADPGYNRALRIDVRPKDPNAGKAPRARFAADQTGYDVGYRWLANGEHQLHDWAARAAWLHFGGTMRPAQRIPSCSEYYMEFEQYLGGFNFGDGTAQLDLRDMKLTIMTL